MNASRSLCSGSLRYCLIMVMLFGSMVLPMQAQFITDTLALVTVTRFELGANNRLSFEVRVRNISPVWRRLANTTLLLDLPTTVTLLNARLDSTSLNRTTYRDTVDIERNTFKLGWFGPDDAADCSIIPYTPPSVTSDRGFLLGKYSVTYTGALPVPSASWRPIIKYQSMAYKLERDTIFRLRGTTFSRNDNIELINTEGRSQGLAFFVETDLPILNVVDFRPVYIGERQARISWRTTSEFANRGFVLARGIRPFGDVTNTNVDYLDTVAIYTRQTNLTGVQSSRTDRLYEFIDSTIRFREEIYAYKLLYDNSANNRRVEVTTGSVFVPNSVISNASAAPNPVTASNDNITRFTYTLDDRCTLTVKLYDAFGREIATLAENVIKDKGTYNDISYNFQAVASQGMYSVVFTAIPTDSNQDVIRTTAFVKVQLIR